MVTPYSASYTASHLWELLKCNFYKPDAIPVI